MTTLYRLWNIDHALLYVGITDNLDARLKDHEAEKPWWTEVGQVSTEELPSRRMALEAEARAIYWEQPRYNILGSPRYSADWEAKYHALEDLEAQRCALPDIADPDDYVRMSQALTAMADAGLKDHARALFDILELLHARSRSLSALEAAGVKRP